MCVCVCVYVCVCMCVCFQLRVDQTCEGVRKHRVLSSRKVSVDCLVIFRASVSHRREHPVLRTEPSGSKVGASSVVRSGPVPVSCVC